MQKTLFLKNISQIFWAKIFFQKPRLSCTTSLGFLAPCQNSDKSNNPIPRKQPERLQEERRDHMIILVTAGDLKSTTAVD